mmetsp:Transcript_47461/g.133533  ORF Transcript_47461/g.133533 Transcript_47461/m.133533 type:complete len:254 (-) Transcript_47461:1118-1879(-)
MLQERARGSLERCSGCRRPVGRRLKRHMRAVLGAGHLPGGNSNTFHATHGALRAIGRCLCGSMEEPIVPRSNARSECALGYSIPSTCGAATDSAGAATIAQTIAPNVFSFASMAKLRVFPSRGGATESWRAGPQTAPRMGAGEAPGKRPRVAVSNGVAGVGVTLGRAREATSSRTFALSRPCRVATTRGEVGADACHPQATCDNARGALQATIAVPTPVGDAHWALSIAAGTTGVRGPAQRGVPTELHPCLAR